MTKPLISPTIAADREARQQRDRLPAEPHEALRVGHMPRQHIGHGQRAEIGGRDDREIEPAGKQRDHHRERQDAKLRQLKRHRLQRADAEELFAEQQPENDDKRDQDAARASGRAAGKEAGQGQCGRGARVSMLIARASIDRLGARAPPLRPCGDRDRTKNRQADEHGSSRRTRRAGRGRSAGLRAG